MKQNIKMINNLNFKYKCIDCNYIINYNRRIESGIRRCPVCRSTNLWRLDSYRVDTIHVKAL